MNAPLSRVIRLKPVTPEITRHARRQVERFGVSIEHLADLFDVDASSLRRRLQQGA